jgi:hypothetical protein
MTDWWPLFADAVLTLCVGAAIGSRHPLHRARSWAVTYLLTLTPERTSLIRVFAAAVMVPDWIIRGHRARNRRLKDLSAQELEEEEGYRW